MPSRPAATVFWALALLVAGIAGVALCLATVPVIAERPPPDLLDSSLLIPVFLGLALLTALMEKATGRKDFRWGFVAPVPFLVWFVASVVRSGDEQGLWPIGMVFLVVLTLVHAGIALAAVAIVPRPRRPSGR
ncbi:hypothetical protein Sme01_07150 [Sphaerisporangium melleum]|uniref:Uncharacterized protein n=1 Tax=Sphaerisporangium melleum TaxID=321316 RepID=A0A917VGI6_9ACTN|nr:hypothetical protein [Sphaerisporangium melleum]GGK73206.1 hypothetical protein GCM10007964_15050 [Sphaerisporangium melleum]GII68239.1 hypothetical protein Sme01_07150 [Sphaerisporangium melleum]